MPENQAVRDNAEDSQGTTANHQTGIVSCHGIADVKECQRADVDPNHGGDAQLKSIFASDVSQPKLQRVPMTSTASLVVSAPITAAALQAWVKEMFSELTTAGLPPNEAAAQAIERARAATERPFSESPSHPLPPAESHPLPPAESHPLPPAELVEEVTTHDLTSPPTFEQASSGTGGGNTKRLDECDEARGSLVAQASAQTPTPNVEPQKQCRLHTTNSTPTKVSQRCTETPVKQREKRTTSQQQELQTKLAMFIKSEQQHLEKNEPKPEATQSMALQRKLCNRLSVPRSATRSTQHFDANADEYSDPGSTVSCKVKKIQQQLLCNRLAKPRDANTDASSDPGSTLAYKTNKTQQQLVCNRLAQPRSFNTSMPHDAATQKGQLAISAEKQREYCSRLAVPRQTASTSSPDGWVSDTACTPTLDGKPVRLPRALLEDTAVSKTASHSDSA